MLCVKSTTGFKTRANKRQITSMIKISVKKAMKPAITRMGINKMKIFDVVLNGRIVFVYDDCILFYKFRPLPELSGGFNVFNFKFQNQNVNSRSNNKIQMSYNL